MSASLLRVRAKTSPRSWNNVSGKHVITDNTCRSVILRNENQFQMTCDRIEYCFKVIKRMWEIKVDETIGTKKVVFAVRHWILGSERSAASLPLYFRAWGRILCGVAPGHSRELTVKMHQVQVRTHHATVSSSPPYKSYRLCSQSSNDEAEIVASQFLTLFITWPHSNRRQEVPSWCQLGYRTGSNGVPTK